MKLISLLVLLVAGFGIYYFIKADSKDIEARKEAVEVKVTIEKLRCKQRLKSDKSLVVVNYQGKSYSLFVTEEKCTSYNLNSIISAFYSKKYDKLFLEK